VEASRTDKVWGAGISVAEAKHHVGDWPGKNLLGRAIMEVRNALRRSGSASVEECFRAGGKRKAEADSAAIDIRRGWRMDNDEVSLKRHKR
jgi:hypothetical protein